MVKNLPHCEELHKPVRKTEKKILNELMEIVRFPIKEKVQLPDQKSYVLLQAAVSKAEIKDFTLRIEQSEMVECAVRLLHCLSELCIERKHGVLLESAVLFERALMVRLWENSDTTPFIQCKELSTSTIDSISVTELKLPPNVIGLNPNQISNRINCSLTEARSILYFANKFMSTKLKATLECDGSFLIICVLPLFESAIESVNRTADESIQCRLICYDSETGELVCHRKLPKGAMKSARFSVPWNDASKILLLRCCIYSNLVGVDFSIGPRFNHPLENVSNKKRQVRQPQLNGPSIVTTASPPVISSSPIVTQEASSEPQEQDNKVKKTEAIKSVATVERSSMDVINFDAFKYDANTVERKWQSPLENFSQQKRSLAGVNLERVRKSADNNHIVEGPWKRIKSRVLDRTSQSSLAPSFVPITKHNDLQVIINQHMPRFPSTLS